VGSNPLAVRSTGSWALLPNEKDMKRAPSHALVPNGERLRAARRPQKPCWRQAVQRLRQVSISPVVCRSTTCQKTSDFQIEFREALPKKARQNGDRSGPARRHATWCSQGGPPLIHSHECPRETAKKSASDLWTIEQAILAGAPAIRAVHVRQSFR